MGKHIVKTLFLLSVFTLVSLPQSIGIEQKFKTQADHEQQMSKDLKRSKHLIVNSDYGRTPLYFIPNNGQVNEKALFYVKASRYSLWLTKEGLVFDSRKKTNEGKSRTTVPRYRDVKTPKDFRYKRDVSQLIFLNANKAPEVVPVDPTEHKVNYFLGDNESKWRTNISTSQAVLYKELYRNVDLKVYGKEKQIEYDFIVKPGGEVSEIGFEYQDVEDTSLDGNGNLMVNTKFGELKHAKPFCYQEIEGKKVEIDAEFERIKENIYKFNVGKYNRDYDLIVDPKILLDYSSYLGGSDEDGCFDIAVDSSGAAYVTGYTFSADFPTQDPIYGALTGGCDVFVTKINPTGDAIEYSTFLGGSNEDRGFSIALDSSNAAYVTGLTYSADFPTQNPFQGNSGGGIDAFVTKINPSGNSLIYSTFLGGSNTDHGWAMTVNPEGAAYLTGYTYSADFPTQDPIYGALTGGCDAFVSKINSSGDTIDFSTYLGGSGNDWSYGITYLSGSGTDQSYGIMTADQPAGDSLWVAGETKSTDFLTSANALQGGNADDSDGFILTLGTSDGYTYDIAGSLRLGGSGDDAILSLVNAISIEERQGEDIVTVGGFTDSTDFPTKNPIQENHAGGKDAFVAWLKKNSEGALEIDNSTYLGGSGDDIARQLYIAYSGRLCVSGETDSTDFPTKNPIQENHAGGKDAFVAWLKKNSEGALEIDNSTYLGGSGDDAGFSVTGLGGADILTVTGSTDSLDFPIKSFQENYAGNIDGFVTKLSFAHYLTISAGDGGTTDPSPETYTYNKGAEVAITAIPNDGYRFSEWSGDASGSDNPITITMDSDKSITANFIKQYTLTITAGTGGTTDPSPGTHTYDSGTQVVVKATANSGYEFSNWSGDASGNTNPITITMDSAKSITANFTVVPTGGDGSGGGGGCFIATACYGTPMAEEVKILCTFRDQYLVINPTGRVFVKVYNRYSPKVADFVRKSEYLKTIVREFLKPVVWIIASLGIGG